MEFAGYVLRGSSGTICNKITLRDTFLERKTKEGSIEPGLTTWKIGLI